MKKILLPLLLLSSVWGCSVNPVTGKNELSFVSPQQEVAIGEKNYIPSRQSQGGDYYLDPELQFYVRNVGQKLAAVSDRPNLPYDFVVLNNPTPNAWALPGGKIAINRGLLIHLEDEAQLAAVLGHEIVHAAARHGATQMTRGTLMNVGLLAVGIGTQGKQGAQLYGMASQLGAAAWMAKYGRNDELESDKYGMHYMSKAGYDPWGAVKLQETFVKLSEGRQSDFLSGLFASHPPSLQRVKENRYLAQQLPKGNRYRERYQRAIAQLKKDSDAYKAQDQALKALRNKESKAALDYLDKAVALQPREGQFWELRGYAWQMMDNKGNTEKAFGTAINKNPNYFSPYLARGILRYEQGNKSAGKADITRSYELLPTPAASYYLGESAMDNKRYKEAANYYQQASQDRGELGKKARQRLTGLKLQLEPHTFIQTRTALDSSGKLVVAVTNTSPAAMTGVRLQIVERVNVLSAVNHKALTVSGTLGAGQQVVVNTGLGPFDSTEAASRFVVQVTAAKAVQ